MTHDYTPEEIESEWRYRYHERIGICCGTRTPTEAEKRLAEKEANEWKKALTETGNTDSSSP